VGLDNYRNLLTSDEFWGAARHTVGYSCLLVLFLFASPFLVAFAITRVGTKWGNFYRSAIFAPTVLSLAVSSIVFLWLLNPVIGVINKVLQLFGIPAVNWLSDPTWAIWAVTVSASWKTFGYNFIVLLAGLLAVPQEMLESARLQGLRSSVGLIRKIIIPLTAGTLIYVFITAIVVGLQYVFVPVEMLTNGGPNQTTSNLIFLVYQYAFQFFKGGLASAAAVITFLGFLLLIIIQAFVLDRRAHYEN
jgi:sn-glycerol 3-phosphate transport system permease protein